MVGMLVADKNGPHFPYRQAQSQHPSFRFPAGDTGIDQHRLMRITDVVAITIAARI